MAETMPENLLKRPTEVELYPNLSQATKGWKALLLLNSFLPGGCSSYEYGERHCSLPHFEALLLGPFKYSLVKWPPITMHEFREHSEKYVNLEDTLLLQVGSTSLPHLDLTCIQLSTGRLEQCSKNDNQKKPPHERFDNYAPLVLSLARIYREVMHTELIMRCPKASFPQKASSGWQIQVLWVPWGPQTLDRRIRPTQGCYWATHQGQ